MHRIVLLSLLAGALADLRLSGSCNNAKLDYQPVDDISVFGDKKWYLAASLGSDWSGGECPTAITKKHPLSPKTELITERLFLKNDKQFHLTRSIKCENNALKQFLNEYSEEQSNAVDYYLLDSDNQTYALIYACVQESPEYKTISALVYSTEKILTPEAVSKLDASTQLYVELKQAPWKVYDHKNCPF